MKRFQVRHLTWLRWAWPPLYISGDSRFLAHLLSLVGRPRFHHTGFNLTECWEGLGSYFFSPLSGCFAPFCCLEDAFAAAQQEEPSPPTPRLEHGAFSCLPSTPGIICQEPL